MKNQRPVVIANNIRLQRSQHSGTFLIVEGRDDRLTFQRHINTEVCKIIVVENKQNVLSVLQILNEDSFEGALGIVDADYDRVEGRMPHAIQNIISPEGHDLESMLLQSSTLDALLVEFGSEEKLRKLDGEVRFLLQEAAHKVGCLRLYSERNGLNLKFKGLKYSAFVDSKTMGIDEKALIQEVLNRSQRKDIPTQEIMTGLNSIVSTQTDYHEICVGTDILGILAVGLRTALGTNNANRVRADHLKSYMRMAFSCANLHATKLWSLSKEWEKRNPNFHVFK